MPTAAAFAVCYMILETIAPVSDDLMVGLPAVPHEPNDQPGPRPRLPRGSYTTAADMIQKNRDPLIFLLPANAARSSDPRPRKAAMRFPNILIIWATPENMDDCWLANRDLLCSASLP